MVSRDALFCALRDQFDAHVEEQIAQYNATMDNVTATAVFEATEALGEMHQAVVTQLVDVHEANLAAKDDLIASLQNQLQAMHCSHIILEHGEVEGDTTIGGSVIFTCHDGYELNGASSALCTNSGLWEPTVTPTCDLVNPCDADEDDCHADATCAHTNGTSHSCECNMGFFGTGQACLPCTTCPDGMLQSDACSPTTDTVCIDPCDGMSCSDHGTCDGGTCTCDDGWVGDACEVEVCGSDPWVLLASVSWQLAYTSFWSQHCDGGPTVPPTEFVVRLQMGSTTDYFTVSGCQAVSS